MEIPGSLVFESGTGAWIIKKQEKLEVLQTVTFYALNLIWHLISESPIFTVASLFQLQDVNKELNRCSLWNFDFLPMTSPFCEIGAHNLEKLYVNF